MKCKASHEISEEKGEFGSLSSESLKLNYGKTLSTQNKNTNATLFMQSNLIKKITF
jgi:hypothetical protein